MSPTFIIFAALFFTAVSAQSPAASPSYAPGPAYTDGPSSDDCLTKLLNVSDCLSFVDIESNLTKPDEPCCGELARLVESSPQCLCELISTKQSVFNISVNRALQLPSLCHVTTPPVSLCSIYGIPVDVPASAPAPIAGGNAGTVSPSGSPGNGASTSSLSSATLVLALGAVLILSPMFS